MRQKIFALYTDDTISMTQSSVGLCPDTAFVDKVPTPSSGGLNFKRHVYQSLIDSSMVTPQSRCDRLEFVTAKLSDCDGILVSYGMDTMAYTANLFALSLQGLNKLVILTGS